MVVIEAAQRRRPLLINWGPAQLLHMGLPFRVIDVQDVMGAEHSLGHANKNEIVSGIDPEPSVRRSEPEESAFTNHFVGLQRVEDNRAIITPPHARPHDLWTNFELARHEIGCKMV